MESVKKELVEVEIELDEVRGATFAGASSSTKGEQKEYEDRVASLKVVKEKTEMVENLQQKVVSGLMHIGEMLGLDAHATEDMSVAEILRDLEAILDSLMDEREKQIQQGQGHNQTSDMSHSKSFGSAPPAVSFYFFVISSSLFNNLFNFHVLIIEPRNSPPIARTGVLGHKVRGSEVPITCKTSVTPRIVWKYRC